MSKPKFSAAQLRKLSDQLSAAVDEIRELKDAADDKANEIEDKHAGRSERWHESDTGTGAVNDLGEFRAEIEGLELFVDALENAQGDLSDLLEALEA